MKSKELLNLIKQALNEDACHNDITSLAIFDKKQHVTTGYLEAKQDMVLSGLEVARLVFQSVDKKIKFVSGHADGAVLKKGERFARITGPAVHLLSAERVALNFLQHLSGIATLTQQYVQKIKPHKVAILDTRKTIPGLRALAKKAVLHGGGHNHRMNLSDQFLIKDNHIAACGGVEKAIAKVKIAKTKQVDPVIEVEVTQLFQIEEAVRAGADIILLDNMTVPQIRKAVKMTNKRCLLEVSGGVNLANVKQIASTGVDRISIGRLTHSAPAVDISLEVLP